MRHGGAQFRGTVRGTVESPRVRRRPETTGGPGSVSRRDTRIKGPWFENKSFLVHERSIRLDRGLRRAPQHLPRVDIEDGAVPGAFDAVLVQHPLVERTPQMGA